MPREIRTTIALDGEAQFKKSLASINSEMRVMASELGRITSGYTENAGSLSAIKQQGDILNQQLEAQQNKVDALKGAVVDSTRAYNDAAENARRLAEQYGENSTQAQAAASAVERAERSMDSWTTQLNQAETALGRANHAVQEFAQQNGDVNSLANAVDSVRNSISGVVDNSPALSRLRDGFQQIREAGSGIAERLQPVRDRIESIQTGVSAAKGAFKLAAEKAGEIKEKLEPALKVIKSVSAAAAKISFKAAEAGAKAVTSSISAATKAFAGYSAAVMGAGAAVGAITGNAAKAADEVNTLSTQTGLSTQEIQKLQYASTRIDVDLETVTGSMAKLTKNMATASKGSGAAADAFSALGVSIKDEATGELRNNQDVFSDAIEAMGKLENETQRDAYAMAIFGKSAQDLNPLIEGGADKLKELGDSAEAAGLIIGQDALNELNAFNDSVDTIKANASSAGKVIGGAFAGKFKQMTDVVGGAVPKLASSLASLFNGKNIASKTKELTNQLSDIGKELIAKAGEMLPDLLGGFNAGILAITGAIAEMMPEAGKTLLPPLLTGFTDLIKGLVKLMPTMLPELTKGAVALFMGIIDGLNEIADTLLPLIPSIVSDVGNILVDNLPLLLQGALTLFMGMVQGLSEMIDQLMPMLPQLIADITQTLVANLPQIITAGFTLLIGLITGITQCIPELIKAVVELIPVITQQIAENLPALIVAGIDLILALIEGFPQAFPALIKAIPDVFMAIVDAFANQEWVQIGIDVIKGIGSGLTDGVKAIGNKVKDAASGVVNGFKSFLGINSPSKVMRDQVGIFMADGVGEGFTAQMKGIRTTMQKAIPTRLDTSLQVGTEFTSSAANLAAQNRATWGVDARMVERAKKETASVVNYNFYDTVIKNDMDIEDLAERLEQQRKRNAAATGVW